MNKILHAEFYTGTLCCTPLKMQHRSHYVDLYTDERVMRKLGPPVSVKLAEKYFQRELACALSVPPERLFWQIENQRAEFCGIQGLIWHRPGSSEAEIGIMLNQKSSGKQIPREGMGALVDFAFNHIYLDKIFAYFTPDNLPVERFVRRLGFKVDQQIHIHKQTKMKYCEIEKPIWNRSEQRVIAITNRQERINNACCS